MNREGKKLAIVVKNLVRTYHHGRVRAVDGLNLAVEEGEIYGLLGPNGAGKTTAIRAILGIINFDQGEVATSGYLMPQEHEKLTKVVGYMPQSKAIYEDLTVAENLKFFGMAYGLNGGDLENRIKEALKRFRIEEFKDTLGASLSGGTRRRLSLICALLHNPRLLILDEPTQGVDPVLRENFWNHFRELAQNKGTTIIVTTHYLDEAAKCDRVGFLREGRLILEGKPREVMKEYGASNMEEVFLIVAKQLEREGKN